jgi:Calx-beta domain/RTX calcium-binding nonapeptide repeat (4 copies)
MAFSSISAKTTFSPEFEQVVNGITQKAQILAEMKKAYEGSTIAKKMFDDWINTPGKTIEINYLKNDFAADPSTGKIYIDLSYLNGKSYINDYGEAVPYSLVCALTHEFGHALKGLIDPKPITDQLTNYKGTNLPFVNTIWKQLGLQPMLSYLATAGSDLQTIGYQYTNYAKIDTAVNVESPKNPPTNWNSSVLGVSKDLLIGGAANNTLLSGGGDDFLFGGGGDDILDGGAGNDTAVYVGSSSDYEVWKQWWPGGDGLWRIKDKNDKYSAGTDILKNIELVQFDNNEVYELKPGGLKFQKNITFVIDKTTNTEIFVDIETNVAKPVLTDIVYLESFDEVTTVVSSQVEYTKSVVSSLINAAFADDNNDVEIGIVAFNDTKIGNPSQVILPFTNQYNFADRKAAALAAINSVTASDGGDIPETPFDGLKLALSGSIGEWRLGAGTRQIFLFTDAPAKDYELAAEVTALAQNIGATITGNTAVALAGGAVNTFNLAFSKTANFSGLTGATDPNIAPVSISQMAAAEPIDPNPTTAQVQIFTIFTGNAATDTSALAKIANDNGGAFLAGLSSEDLVKRLAEIINPLPTAQPPTISIIASDPDATETKSGEIADSGQFILNRTGDLTQSLAVSYTLSGTATNVTDYQTIASTVTFAAGNNTATINVQPLDDNIYEGNDDCHSNNY